MLAALLLLVAQAQAPKRLPEPSSAVVIVLDDVAAADLALYGGPVATPYMAALASQGVTFTRAYAMPTCAPTRRVMQTGHWWSTGTGNPCEPPTAHWPTLDEVFIPEALPGHQSAMLGKWHLGGDPFGGGPACAPQAHGYDFFVAGQPSNVNECGGSSFFNWTRLDNCVQTNSHEYEPRAVRDAFRAGWLGSSGPRFAMVCPNLAHAPFHPPPVDLLPPGYPPPTTARTMYEAMIRAQDTLIGQMLAGISLKDTLIIVVGDNGTPPQVAPDRNKAKGSVFERGVRVPLIIAGGPTVAPGRSSDAFVHAIDIYATVIDALGGTVPSTSGPYPVASVSLVPLLKDAASPFVPREHLFLATRWGTDEGEIGAVSRSGIKLRQLDTTGDKVADAEELYDLSSDPNETVNLIADPAYALELADLRAYIAASVLP